MNLKSKRMERKRQGHLNDALVATAPGGGSAEQARNERAEHLKSIAAAVKPSKRQPSEDQALASKPPAGADLEDSI